METFGFICSIIMGIELIFVVTALFDDWNSPLYLWGAIFAFAAPFMTFGYFHESLAAQILVFLITAILGIAEIFYMRYTGDIMAEVAHLIKQNKMEKYKIIDRCLAVATVICVLVLGFLFALNGRYEIQGNCVYDSWTKTSTYLVDTLKD